MQIRPAQLAAHLAAGLRRCMSSTATSRCWRSRPATQIRAAARARRLRRARSPGRRSRASSGTRSLARQRNLGLFGDAQADRPAHSVRQARRRGRAALEDCAGESEPRTTSRWSRCRGSTARRRLGVVRRARAAPASAIAVLPARTRRAAALDRRAARAAEAARRAETLQFLADAPRATCSPRSRRSRSSRLLLPEGELAHDAVERAVADVARFDVFQLSEAWLAGDAARALRILAALEAAGEGVPLLLWQLGEDLHALAAVLQPRPRTARRSPPRCATRASGASARRRWSARRGASRRAAIPPLLLRLARLDALAKGIGRGNAWDELARCRARALRTSARARRPHAAPA